MRWFLIPSLLFASAYPISYAIAQNDTDRAVSLMREFKFQEAIRDLRAEIRANPHDFYAYQLLWQNLEQTCGSTCELKRIRSDIRFLDNVPKSSRTEFYYEASEYGLRKLGLGSRAEAIQSEAVQRFPDGRTSRAIQMAQALALTDPQESIRALNNLAAKYKSIPYFADQVRQQELSLLPQLPPSKTDLRRQVLSDWVQSQQQISLLQGRSLIYLNAELEASLMQASEDPIDSLEYCSEALADHSATDPESIPSLGQLADICFEDSVALGEEEKSLKYGDLIDRSLSEGKLDRTAREEASFRTTYSQVLDRTGKWAESFRQIGEASRLDPRRLADLNNYLHSHPEYNRNLAHQEGVWDENIAVEREKRDAQLRMEIEKTETHVQAGRLAYTDARGVTRTLEELRGQEVVLLIWASWCHFCKEELSNIDDLAASLRTPVVALSVDDDVASAKQIIAGRQSAAIYGLTKIAKLQSFAGDILPRLFVIDTNGYIRFRIDGTVADLDHRIRIMLGMSRPES